MTAPWSPDAFGAPPRRRPLVSPADLIWAVAELAPEDPVRARELAALLGLRPGPARRRKPAAPAEPQAGPAQGPRTDPAAVRYSAAEPQMAAGIVASRLIPLQQDDQVTDERWLADVNALAPPPSTTAGQARAVEPLFLPRWTVGIVSAALAADTAGPPDIARAVAVLARGRALDRMPTLPRLSLRRGAQVLVDLGTGMDPFRHDQESLVAALRRSLGAKDVEVLHFADCPGRDTGAPGAARWTAYRAPRRGVPVVLLTDLGLGSAAGEARPAEWRAFLGGVRAGGSPCIAFVPYPPERVPRQLRAAALIIRWDRATTAGWIRRRRTGIHR